MNLTAVPLLDLAFPRTCCACGAAIANGGETGLCWDCRSDTTPLTPPCCDRCGVAVAGRVDHRFECGDCREHPPAYTRARSLFRYEGGVRDAIHALKYHRDFSVVPDLARLLAAGIRVHADPVEGIALVPVPLHPLKSRARGFNQSGELLCAARRHLPGTKLWSGVKRAKNTETQTRLSKPARRENVRGAFRVTRHPVPERILLFDDVMTTGSTADACAKALKKAGAKEITVLTLARG